MIPNITLNAEPDCIIQSGVIPYIIENGTVKVILITSRKRKKWILPKGFIDEGLTPPESAGKEAYEEAGVLGTVSEKSAGYYSYTRQEQKYKVSLFPMLVDNISDQWPESTERERVTVELSLLKNYIVEDGITGVINNYFHCGNFENMN